jgi:hypothetical protein
MWKKIILGTLCIGLIAVLVYGAVNRTNSKLRSSDDRSSEQERDRQGEGQGNQRGSDGNDNASSRASSVEWETFQGTIIDVTESELLTQTSSGDQLLIEGRAWSYIQEQGFSVQPEDQVTLTGFYENDEFKVGSVDNITSGQSIIVRESGGRPMWAGGEHGGA